MIRSALLAASLLAATEAAALSCPRPDPLRSFQEAQAAPDNWLVLRGRLDLDPAALPDRLDPDATMPAPPPVVAHFEGFALDRDGFTRPMGGDVGLVVQCHGPFCGAIAPGEEWLLFARLDEAGPTVFLDPCGTWAFDSIPDDLPETLAACLRGEACGTP